MNKYLIIGGTFSILASLLHIAIIIGGPDWYRFWGAGEGIAVMAENGSWVPAIVTFIFFIILFLWGLYAFSGAGLIKRLPLLKTALILISILYLIHGLSLVLTLLSPFPVTTFNICTSLFTFIMGLTYAFGTKQVWASISR